MYFVSQMPSNAAIQLFTTLPTTTKYLCHHFQSPPNIFHSCTKLLPHTPQVYCHIYLCYLPRNYSRYFLTACQVIIYIRYPTKATPKSLSIFSLLLLHLFVSQNNALLMFHTSPLDLTLQIHLLACVFPLTSFLSTFLSTCTKNFPRLIVNVSTLCAKNHFPPLPNTSSMYSVYPKSQQKKIQKAPPLYTSVPL